MTATYDTGALVDVLYRRAEVTGPAEVGPSGRTVLPVRLPTGVIGHVVLDDGNATVTPVAPTGWPPRPGDIWATAPGQAERTTEDGEPTSDLFVCLHRLDLDEGHDRIVLVPLVHDPEYATADPEVILRECWPLALRYRVPRCDQCACTLPADEARSGFTRCEHCPPDFAAPAESGQ